MAVRHGNGYHKAQVKRREVFRCDLCEYTRPDEDDLKAHVKDPGHHPGLGAKGYKDAPRTESARRHEVPATVELTEAERETGAKATDSPDKETSRAAGGTPPPAGEPDEGTELTELGKPGTKAPATTDPEPGTKDGELTEAEAEVVLNLVKEFDQKQLQGFAKEKGVKANGSNEDIATRLVIAQRGEGQ